MSLALGCRVAAPARARPALYREPCRASTPCRAARLPSAPSRAPRLSYRGPSGRVVGTGCAPAGRIAGPVPRAGWPCPGLAVLYCNTTQPFLLRSVTIKELYCNTILPSSHCSSCCVTIQFLCIKTQSLSLLASLLQYSLCLAIQFPAKPTSSCNTIARLAIQRFFFFHNIVWAVAQTVYAQKISLLFFFHFFFHFPLVPATGKF